MALYRVKQFSRTVATILVDADSPEQAEEIAQLDHVDFGKEEVLEIEYEAERVEPDWPETVFTLTGQEEYTPPRNTMR